MAITIIGGDTNHTNQISQAQSNYWGGSDDSMGGYAASFNSSGGTDPALMHTLKKTNQTLNQMNQSMQSSNDTGKAIGWGALATVAAAGAVALVAHNPEPLANFIEKGAKLFKGDEASIVEKNARKILGDTRVDNIIKDAQKTASNAVSGRSSLTEIGKVAGDAVKEQQNKIKNLLLDESALNKQGELRKSIETEEFGKFINTDGNRAKFTTAEGVFDEAKAKMAFSTHLQADENKNLLTDRYAQEADLEKIRQAIRGDGRGLGPKLQKLADQTRGMSAVVHAPDSDEIDSKVALKTVGALTGIPVAAGVVTTAALLTKNAIDNNNNQQQSYFDQPQYYYC